MYGLFYFSTNDRTQQAGWVDVNLKLCGAELSEDPKAKPKFNNLFTMRNPQIWHPAHAKYRVFFDENVHIARYQAEPPVYSNRCAMIREQT